MNIKQLNNKTMKRVIFYFVLGLATTYFYSCSDDELQAVVQVPDGEKPVITILSPANLAANKPLRATVTVRAQATDNTGIAKVEVFVDGTSVVSSATSPVEASWNTKTVADGTHEIKVVAEDTEGNKEELLLPVEVKNILFTFQIGQNHLNAETEGWIFISDASGKTLDNQQMVNGQTLVFETPEGFETDDEFTFNRLERSLFDNFILNTFINSYQGLKSSSFTLDDGIKEPENPPVIGSSTITVSNTDFSYFTGVESLEASEGFFAGSFPPDQIPIVADLWKAPAKVIFWIRNEDLVLQYEAPSLMPGEVINLDISDFTPFDFINVPVEGATFSNYGLSYLLTPGDYDNTGFFNFEQDGNPEAIEVFSPNLNPPEFIASLSYGNANESNSYTLVSAELPTEFKKLNGEITSFAVNGSEIEIGSIGNFNFLQARSSFFSITETLITDIDWSIFDGPGTSLLKIPAIPDALLQLYPELAENEFVFDAASLSNYIGIDGYEEWVKLRFSESSLFSVAKDIRRKTQFFTPSGGKVAPKSDKQIRFDDGYTKFQRKK